MKSFAIALAIALVAATSVPSDAFARRIGGGGTAGMQRSVPPRAAPEAPRPTAPAAQPAGPNAAAAAAPAAAAKRSWLGPIAGLAAGLGIAALMSHLGLGAEFGNIIMMVLLAVAAFALIRFLMRRFMPSNPAAANGGLQLAGAGAPVAKAPVSFPDERPAQYRGLQPGADAPLATTAGSATPAAALAPIAAASVPAGFDVPAFERIAKMIFIRMQAANDNTDLNDLRAFTTPEMFAAIKLDLQERGAKGQRTDVVRVDAEVLDVASEAERQIVSVRFHGLVREEENGVAEPFDEVWHLVKPADGSREWAIAGIQQTSPAFA
jgi:predicted lipid-binding transport protein (Tim44 family)